MGVRESRLFSLLRMIIEALCCGRINVTRKTQFLCLSRKALKEYSTLDDYYI